jgi:hypothetical protein
MGTAASGPENVAKHQNLHFSGIPKGEQKNKLTAKNFKANMIKELAEATEELIAIIRGGD